VGEILILIAIGIVIAFSVDLLNSTLVRKLRYGNGVRIAWGRGFGRSGDPVRAERSVFWRRADDPQPFHYLLGGAVAGFARDISCDSGRHELETARCKRRPRSSRRSSPKQLTALNAQLNSHFLFKHADAVPRSSSATRAAYDG